MKRVLLIAVPLVLALVIGGPRIAHRLEVKKNTRSKDVNEKLTDFCNSVETTSLNVQFDCRAVLPSEDKEDSLIKWRSAIISDSTGLSADIDVEDDRRSQTAYLNGSMSMTAPLVDYTWNSYLREYTQQGEKETTIYSVDTALLGQKQWIRRTGDNPKMTITGQLMEIQEKLENKELNYNSEEKEIHITGDLPAKYVFETISQYMNVNEKLLTVQSYVHMFIAGDLKAGSMAHVELILDAENDNCPRTLRIDFSDAAEEWFSWLFTKINIPEKLKVRNPEIIGSIEVNFRAFNYREQLQVPKDVVKAAEKEN